MVGVCSLVDSNLVVVLFVVAGVLAVVDGPKLEEAKAASTASTADAALAGGAAGTVSRGLITLGGRLDALGGRIGG